MARKAFGSIRPGGRGLVYQAGERLIHFEAFFGLDFEHWNVVGIVVLVLAIAFRGARI
jgi:hypothetical protein